MQTSERDPQSAVESRAVSSGPGLADYRDDLKSYLLAQLGDEYGEIDLDTPLLEYGILDSILIQGLLAFVEDRYQILLPPEDVRPERFGTLRGMAQVVHDRAESDHGGEGTDAYEAINVLMESYGLERRWVETSYGRQHLLATRGNRPRLVFLPGLGSPASSWGLLLRSLQNRREAVAIDLAGFGVSDPTPNGRYPFATHVENTIEILESFPGDEPFVLVGNSAGAMVGAEITKRREACLGLVVVSFGRVRDARTWWRELSNLSADADAFWQRAFFDPPPLSSGLRRQFQATLSSAAYQEFLDDEALDRLDGLFAEVEVPTLFIAGQDDRIVAPEIVRAGAEQAPHGRFEELVRCGHYAQSERSEELLVYLEHFLGGLKGATS